MTALHPAYPAGNAPAPGPRVRCDTCGGKVTEDGCVAVPRTRHRFSPHSFRYRCRACVNGWEALHRRPLPFPEVAPSVHTAAGWVRP